MIKGFSAFFRLHLHSPHKSSPPLHFLALSSDSVSDSKKYRKYQKTGQMLKFAPSLRCNSTVGCPPVNEFDIFLSINSSLSVVKIAVSGMDDDIFPFMP